MGAEDFSFSSKSADIVVKNTITYHPVSYMDIKNIPFYNSMQVPEVKCKW